jgi:hypothetical protein
VAERPQSVPAASREVGDVAGGGRDPDHAAHCRATVHDPDQWAVADLLEWIDQKADNF